MQASLTVHQVQHRLAARLDPDPLPLLLLLYHRSDRPPPPVLLSLLSLLPIKPVSVPCLSLEAHHPRCHHPTALAMPSMGTAIDHPAVSPLLLLLVLVLRVT